MIQVEVYNETEEEISFLEKIKEIVIGAMKMENIVADCNIIIIDDDYIHELNKTYRNIDRPTDVITFALEDEKKCILPDGQRILGDIYISIDTAKRQALEYGHGIEREVCFLAIHGFYHLLGYDHQTLKEEEVMFAKQEEVLSKYGINR